MKYHGYNYDNRANILTPSKGFLAELKSIDFKTQWSNDKNYSKYSAFFMNYTSLHVKFTLGSRASAKLLLGNASFYAYHFDYMRGVKTIQFQGDQILLGEAELSWNFFTSMALVGFGGTGKAYNDSIKADSNIIYSHGASMRYLIASQ